MGNTVISDDLTVTVRPRVDLSGPPSTGQPVKMFSQAIRRLRIVVGMIVLFTVLGWIGVNALEGGLVDEFRRPGDWVPPTAGLAASLGIYLMTRSSRFSVFTVLKAGLAYEVLVSYGMAIGQYWNTFHDLTGERLTPDLVGVSAVALWMAFFTVLVPTKPRHALVALVLSGSAVPLTIATLVRMGNVPPQPPLVFITVFVLPYVITVFMCMVAANVIYGLGREATAAQQLGSYQLLSLLGSGGMGKVWRAKHQLLARPAAIKLIRPEALSTDPVTQNSIMSRFEREAQVTASLQSPHTVELYDFGVSDSGDMYYVMELLTGIDLDALVRRFGPVTQERAVHILRQVCASLAEAHRRNLIHRDVKPANIMVCKSALVHDFVKVLDFGLAKQALHAGADSSGESGSTAAGAFVGTPAYVAPEAISGSDNIDGRSDLYSLGCVAFWLLTGRPVFAEATAMATLLAQTNATPEPPSKFSPGPVSAALDSLILHCLEKSPGARPASAGDLAAALTQLSGDSPWVEDRARQWWQRHLPS